MNTLFANTVIPSAISKHRDCCQVKVHCPKCDKSHTYGIGLNGSQLSSGEVLSRVCHTRGCGEVKFIANDDTIKFLQ
jgi:hypothetical protein